MPGISMIVNEGNQLSVVERIVAELSGKSVNFLVETIKLGDKKPKVTKFCKRELGGTFLLNGNQVKIAFLPAGGIAWDLNVELVTVRFGSDGVTLCRFFPKAQRSKIVRITVDPI